MVGRRSPLLVSGRHSPSVERDRGGPGVKLLPGVLRVLDKEPDTHDGAEHAAGYGCLPVSTRAQARTAEPARLGSRAALTLTATHTAL